MRWSVPSRWKSRLGNAALSRALYTLHDFPNESMSRGRHLYSTLSWHAHMIRDSNVSCRRRRSPSEWVSRQEYHNLLESPGGVRSYIHNNSWNIPSIQASGIDALRDRSTGERMMVRGRRNGVPMKSFSTDATHTFTRRLLKNVIKRVAGDTLKFSPSKRADEHYRFGSNEDSSPKNSEGSTPTHKFHSEVNHSAVSQTRTSTGEPSLIDTPVLDIPSPLSVDDFLLNHLNPVDTLDLGAFPDLSEVDPFKLTEGEISNISENIQGLLGVDHPVLSTVSHYFFKIDGGKKLRPTMVVLMSQAMNYHRKVEEEKNGYFRQR
eukprot:gb/GECG01008890.1/.p1 GENE.gb/GECG01008890.1/~~gb/GECG01008890.1/.p1  ORF type:complete len:320 (+),score=23.43 gb/GECG01008890.1/:1-960(+)